LNECERSRRFFAKAQNDERASGQKPPEFIPFATMEKVRDEVRNRIILLTSAK